jgi:hypothetical protein
MTLITTDSSTRASSSVRQQADLHRRRLLALPAWLVLAGLAGMPATSHASGIVARSAHLEAGDEGWLLDADFVTDLGSTLIEAVEHGVALYFAVDVEIRRSRWYWFDEHVVDTQIPIRLTYNALTRQYRVMFGAGPFAQRFDEISEAALAVGRVHGWKIAERTALKAGAHYQMSTRLRLDIAQLPRPFQVSAITNRDWALQSEWLRVQVSA